MHSGEGLCINKTQLCASIKAYKCAKHTMYTYMPSHIYMLHMHVNTLNHTVHVN